MTAADPTGADVTATLAALQQQVTDLQREVAELRGARAATGPSAFDALYPAFEDRFRGDPADIRQRLGVYLPDLATAPTGLPLLDVGPGRGEWLGLVEDAGVEGYGVDLDAQFVAAAQARGQRVLHAEAVEHLQDAAPGSFGAVTAFHVVEHLATDVLVELLVAARCALAPGGLLLLETPNPSNVVMGACNFYLDPTHQRPLPPALLEFLVRAAGFTDVVVRPLHLKEPVELGGMRLDGVSEKDTALLGAALTKGLFGPQDYAIVARVDA